MKTYSTLILFPPVPFMHLGYANKYKERNIKQLRTVNNFATAKSETHV